MVASMNILCEYNTMLPVGGVDGEDVVAKPFGSPLGGLHRRAPYGRLYPT